MKVTVDHAVLLELVAFVDQEHETSVDTCHPQPGIDCAAHCGACKLLAQLPPHMLMGARVLLNGRGVERD
jgi:hypothetical protein